MVSFNVIHYLGPRHIQPSTITMGQPTNRVFTNSACMAPVQDGKDVQTNNSTILDKGNVESHIIHSS